MNKTEIAKYKRFARRACKAEGINIPMTHMRLLESGSNMIGVDYVMFEDFTTGIEYQCFYGSKYYTAEHPGLYMVEEYK